MLKQRAETAGVHLILIAYCLLAIGPILLVVMNSFKARKAIFGAPLAPPNADTFSLIGYTKVFSASHVGTYFMNSLIVTLVSMLLVLLFGAMAAWALTEYRFRGSTALALFLSIGIMVPIRLGSVAILTMMREAGLNDTLTALILVYIAQGLPLSIFILSEFVQQIPHDLRDAARCDGVPETRIFFEVIAPLLEARDRDRRGVHHRADLERPVVPADPDLVRFDAHDHARRAAVPRPVHHRLELGSRGAVDGDPAGRGDLCRLLAAADQRPHRRRGQIGQRSAMATLRIDHLNKSYGTAQRAERHRSCRSTTANSSCWSAPRAAANPRFSG